MESDTFQLSESMFILSWELDICSKQANACLQYSLNLINYSLPISFILCLETLTSVKSRQGARSLCMDRVECEYDIFYTLRVLRLKT